MTNEWNELSADELTNAIHDVYATSDEDEYGFPIDEQTRERVARTNTEREAELAAATAVEADAKACVVLDKPYPYEPEDWRVLVDAGYATVDYQNTDWEGRPARRLTAKAEAYLDAQGIN